MSGRLTPERVISRTLCDLPGTVGLIGRMDITASTLVSALAVHGYVIVHPDDVRERPRGLGTPDGYAESQLGEFEGWNACRDSIFGGRP